MGEWVLVGTVCFLGRSGVLKNPPKRVTGKATGARENEMHPRT